MIVTCPACATRYSVEPSSIAPDGRKVRCTRCGHVWLQLPPADMPKRVDLLPDLADRDVRPETVVVPPPMPSRERRRRSGSGGWLGLVLLLLIVGFAASIGYVGRERIVERWPEVAPLYERIGIDVAAVGEGLQLGEPTHVRRAVDGVDVIEIEGEIRNATEADMAIPNLLVMLRNDADQTVLERVYAAPRPALQAGETLRYKIAIEEPPSEAIRAAITFTEAPPTE
ncbi:MAG: DUF3426 domain-containing protein [Dongiaceae bacterium]